MNNAGYQIKVYEVPTEDGYILKMHRILLKDTMEVTKKGAVFLMHGLFGTAADFVMTGPETALGNCVVKVESFKFQNITLKLICWWTKDMMCGWEMQEAANIQ